LAETLNPTWLPSPELVLGDPLQVSGASDAFHAPLAWALQSNQLCQLTEEGTGPERESGPPRGQGLVSCPL
jgi:hypothetical protein